MCRYWKIVHKIFVPNTFQCQPWFLNILFARRYKYMHISVSHQWNSVLAVYMKKKKHWKSMIEACDAITFFFMRTDDWLVHHHTVGCVFFLLLLSVPISNAFIDLILFYINFLNNKLYVIYTCAERSPVTKPN